MWLYFFSFFFLTIVVSVACPTGPHPPLRLARRPNRGHIGGGVGPPPAVHAYDVFIASGSTSTSTNLSTSNGLFPRPLSFHKKKKVGTESVPARGLTIGQLSVWLHKSLPTVTHTARIMALSQAQKNFLANMSTRELAEEPKKKDEAGVNCYNPIIQFCSRSNTDIRVLLRDSDARGACNIYFLYSLHLKWRAPFCWRY